jgi:hypothetical protein
MTDTQLDLLEHLWENGRILSDPSISKSNLINALAQGSASYSGSPESVPVIWKANGIFQDDFGLTR